MAAALAHACGLLALFLLAGAPAAAQPTATPAEAENAQPGPEPAQAENAQPEGTPYDEYDELYFDEEFADAEDTGDPLEPVNRGIFAFNDGLDQHVLEPVATGLDYAIPDFIQRAIRNAFDNLRFPILLFNDLFQLKPRRAGEDIARFAINTTVGIGGLMDPAATIGLRKRQEDFGQTLGFWGVPPGPYLMVPFFGPSNVRDGFGVLVDSAFRAVGFFIPFWASIAMQAVDTLNRRSLIRHEIQAERRAALDWYAAVRSAYSQYRENLVQDRREGAETEYGFYPQFESDEKQQ